MSLLEIALQIEKEIQKKALIKQSNETHNIIDLTLLLNTCCHGLNISPDEVKNRLLSQGNIEDIINGDISARTIKSHIQLWIVEGKQNYSGNSE